MLLLTKRNIRTTPDITHSNELEAHLFLAAAARLCRPIPARPCRPIPVRLSRGPISHSVGAVAGARSSAVGCIRHVHCAVYKVCWPLHATTGRQVPIAGHRKLADTKPKRSPSYTRRRQQTHTHEPREKEKQKETRQRKRRAATHPHRPVHVQGHTSRQVKVAGARHRTLVDILHYGALSRPPGGDSDRL